MPADKLGKLLHAFASYYWSVPVEFVFDKIRAWHPEVTAQQFTRVLKHCNKNPFENHCIVIKEEFDKPELVVEHLYAVGDDDLDRFIAARIDGPYADCDENTLFAWQRSYPDMAEIKAILDFGRSELGLDDTWALQLVDDALFCQAYALIDGKSWVKSVLLSETYGQIHFTTVAQVARYRELGNALYMAAPNPVLKRRKPCEIANPPHLPDDMPQKDEDIPDNHAAMDKLRASHGNPTIAPDSMKKIGRNDPCPCGSGLKFKKCACAQYHGGNKNSETV